MALESLVASPGFFVGVRTPISCLMTLLDERMNTAPSKGDDGDPGRPSERGWPSGLFLAAWLIALITLFAFTPALDGYEANRGRAIVQVMILTLLLVRLLIARIRKERNETWWYYVIGMVLAAPLWLLVEQVVW